MTESAAWGDQQVTLVEPNRLTLAQIQHWKRILREHPWLSGPQLQPEFAQAVQAAGRSVEIAVIENKEKVVGFFAFSRVSSTIAEPIGGVTSDQEALIVPEHAKLDFIHLLKACRLTQWNFSHFDARQCATYSNAAFVNDCLVADLAAGYAEYLANIRQKHGSWLSNLERKSRKLAREHGAISFQWHSSEAPTLLQMLAGWKRQLLQEQGFADMFRETWVSELFQQCLRHDSCDFQVVVSSLSAGESIVAIHLGLQSGNVLLSWIPTFNPEFAKYSPGAQLLLRIAEAAAERQIERFEFGSGDNQTKSHLTTSSYPVAIGRVSTVKIYTSSYNSLLRLKRKIGTWEFVRRWRRTLRKKLFQSE